MPSYGLSSLPSCCIPLLSCIPLEGSGGQRSGGRDGPGYSSIPGTHSMNVGVCSRGK